MDLIVKPGKPVIGFAANTKGTADFEIGPRYRSITMEFIATAAAATTLTRDDFVGLITVMIGGKPQRIHLASELDAIQRSYGAHYACQVYNHDGGVYNYTGGAPQVAQPAKETALLLTLWFEEPWRKNWTAAEMGAWPTLWPDGSKLSSLQLEVTGGPTTHLLAGTNITCTLWPETDAQLGPMTLASPGNPSVPIKNIAKWYRNPTPYGGAGDLQILNLPKLESYREIRVFCQAGDDITKALVTVAGRTVRQVTKAVNDLLHLYRDFSTVQADSAPTDRFDIIFDANDKPSSALYLQAGGQTVTGDFAITLTLNQAAAANKVLNILSQRYGPID